MIKSKILSISGFIALIFIFYMLVEAEISFYLSALERGFEYPILKIGLTISIVYLLYCIIHLIYRLNQNRIINKSILVLQTKLIIGQVLLMIIMFFVRMR